MIAGLAAFSTPALAGLFAARVAPSGLSLKMSGAPAQNAGDLPPSGWGSETLAHSRNPTPTVLDPNDPKAKQTHIPQGESFAEYMARKNGGAAAAAAPAYAPPAAAPAYSPPPQQYAPPPQQYAPPPQQYAAPPPSYQPAPAATYQPTAGAPAQNAGDLPPSGWGTETLAHSRNPTPTQIDPNDPKSKQTHIPQGESFSEYMARRAAEGK